jgi:hypothetical protein
VDEVLTSLVHFQASEPQFLCSILPVQNWLKSYCHSGQIIENIPKVFLHTYRSCEEQWIDVCCLYNVSSPLLFQFSTPETREWTWISFHFWELCTGSLINHDLRESLRTCEKWLHTIVLTGPMALCCQWQQDSKFSPALSLYVSFPQGNNHYYLWSVIHRRLVQWWRGLGESDQQLHVFISYTWLLFTLLLIIKFFLIPMFPTFLIFPEGPCLMQML